MSSYYGFQAQNAQLASYMAAAAAASQTANLQAGTAPNQYQVAYPTPNQYNPQYSAMYSAAPIKTVTVVTSTSAVKPVQRAQELYSNFVPAGQAPSSSSNSYDATVLSAASNSKGYGYGNSAPPSMGRGNNSNRRGWGKRGSSVAAPPGRASVYYCECCKISCAGPQTWQEHIAGSKHKKREAALQAGKDCVPGAAKPGTSFLKCAVCDITVTGSDAFVAHVNGAKHLKTIKVYQQMGKPVPSSEPVVVTPNPVNSTDKKAAVTDKKKGALTKGSTILGTAKVAFVPAGQLHTIGVGPETEASTEKEVVETEVPKVEAKPKSNNTGVLYLPNEKDVAPVGAEYVEEIYSDVGKLVSYKCKLCDCSFNDTFAKEMHLKGRRHRLAYKQKVDPTLVVETKSNFRNKRSSAKGVAGNSIYYQQPRAFSAFGDPYYHAAKMRPLYTSQSFGASELDDQYVLAKHSMVYASPKELASIQNIVLRLECALKITSDQLLEQEIAKQREQKLKDSQEKESWTPSQQEIQQMRHLRGVQRCGPLAKGLLICGDRSVDLVVMCLQKPTHELLERVCSSITENLKTASGDSNSNEAGLTKEKVELSDFHVSEAAQEATILVSTMAKYNAENADEEINDDTAEVSLGRRFECRIFFTSQVIGEEASDAASDPSDMLPRQCCLNALAKLRHAKFFQAKLSPNSEAMVALRILRDLSRRVPTWNPFPQWALELLMEKCSSTASVSLSAAQLLRRVFECIAAGILLPGGPGIFDPCERELTDAAAALSEQQREDITASAQHALRLIAFGLIWKVLGIERTLSQPNPRKSSAVKRKAVDDSSVIDRKSALVEPMD